MHQAASIEQKKTSVFSWSAKRKKFFCRFHYREFFGARTCPCDGNMSPPQLRETDPSPTPPPETSTPAGEISTFVPPTPPSQTLFFNLENPISAERCCNNNRQTSRRKAIWPLPHCLPAHDGGDLQRTDLVVRLRAVLLPFAVVNMKTRQKSPALIFVSTINSVIRREQAEIKVRQQKFFSRYARLIRRF